MSHGESQKEGQEESQEEVILRPWSIRRARNFLARHLNSKTLPATKRAVSFQGSGIRSEFDECAKHWKTSRGARSAGIRGGRQGTRRRHRIDREFSHR